MHLSRFTLFLSLIFLASLVSSLHPLSAQEPTPRPTFVNEHSDLNQDNVVDAEDLLIFMQDWGKVTGPVPTRTPTHVPTHTWTPTETATPIPVEHSLLIEMVTLPAGSFQMGNSGSARDVQYSLRVSTEQPRHQVNMDYSFQMGKYQVTNAQYAEVLTWAKGRGYLRNSNGNAYNGANVYHNGQFLFNIIDGPYGYNQAFIYYNGSRFNVESRNRQPQHNNPVIGVTWYGAVAFCNWLSEMEDRTPAYNLSSWTLTNRDEGGYRLPSEAEWEYACRGSENNPNRYDLFFFGDDTDVDLGARTFSPILNQYMVWRGQNPASWDLGWSYPVGIKKPNDYGLHDMHGNVREWCEDWWHPDYTGAPTDGSAWLDKIDRYPNRVLRGGSWFDFAASCRSASRGSYSPTGWIDLIGFRLARTP